LIIALIINVLYTYSLYPRDFKTYSPVLTQCKSVAPGADIVYFGESSNMTVSENDSVKETISGLISVLVPEKRVVAIDTYAVHSGIYKYWAKQFSSFNKPKCIIITMNLRSFGAAWIHSKAESSLKKSVRMAETPFAALNRFALALRMPSDKTQLQSERETLMQWRHEELDFPYPFPYKTTKEWDDGTSEKLKNKNISHSDSTRIMLACHYIKAFAFRIKDNNPRVNDFDKIAEWGKANNVKIYFNLLAENIQLGGTLVGKELVYLMQQNRDYLVKRYSARGAIVIDNLEIVEPEYFIDKNWTTEHYSDKGRMKIARNVVEHLNLK
jgi:hypothetical protein